jgi:hypothetical protein
VRLLKRKWNSGDLPRKSPNPGSRFGGRPPSPATLPRVPSIVGVTAFVPTRAVGNRLDAARDAGVDLGVDAEGLVAHRPARVFDVEGGREGGCETVREGGARRGKAKVVVVLEEMITMPCQTAPSRRSRAVGPNRTKRLDVYNPAHTE